MTATIAIAAGHYMMRCNSASHGWQVLPILKYPTAQEPHKIPEDKEHKSATIGHRAT
jgi:hypothetical protein